MVFDELRRTVAALERDIATGPIVPDVSPAELREHLARYDFSNPLPLDDVIADAEAMMRRWHVQVTHPRYLGLFNPSVTPASVVGETMAAMFNPQLASWRTSPAANEIERHTLRWLAVRFSLPATSTAHFTTGSAEANLTAVIVALTHAFPEHAESGLRGLPAPPVIYLTREAHQSFFKIARISGLGCGALRTIATDAAMRMDAADLQERIAADRRSGLAPLMVVGTVGTTAAGAIDPLPEIAEVCRSERLWLHVDAAWGGAAILSPMLRPYLAGTDAADSITCDAHKWFSVPLGAGMFFCRHPQAVAAAFGAHASYMPGTSGAAAADPYSTSMQWSRRFNGLKLFLSLAERGECGYAQMIEQQTRMGDLLRSLLRMSGWRIVNETPLPLVCFTRDGLDAGRFLDMLYRHQIAWMSQVRLADGESVLRACITSYRTTATEIEEIVREMTRLAVSESEATT
jgi:aromatic-L-amino-acid decarboxylase